MLRSPSFLERQLLKKRRVEMLAVVAMQSWSQSSVLQPLQPNVFVNQCLLAGLLDLQPADGQQNIDGSFFDPVGLNDEDEAGVEHTAKHIQTSILGRPG